MHCCTSALSPSTCKLIFYKSSYHRPGSIKIIAARFKDFLGLFGQQALNERSRRPLVMAFKVYITGGEREAGAFAAAVGNLARQRVTSMTGAVIETNWTVNGLGQQPKTSERCASDMLEQVRVEFTCALSLSRFPALEDAIMARCHACVCPVLCTDRKSVEAARGVYERAYRMKEARMVMNVNITFVALERTDEEQTVDEWRELEQLISQDEAVRVSHLEDRIDFGKWRHTSLDEYSVRMETGDMVNMLSEMLDRHNSRDSSPAYTLLGEQRASNRWSSPCLKALKRLVGAAYSTNRSESSALQTSKQPLHVTCL